MDAADRIVEEFNRLVALGLEGVAACPKAERIVYYIVATRCEIEINGFSSVYEQGFDAAEIALLVEGLNMIGESTLATEFQRGYDLLRSNGFYKHMTWKKVSPIVKRKIESIGKRVGSRLWDLDSKLADLLDRQREQPEA